MSEIPPTQNPDPNRPPEGYAAYPRGPVGPAPYGTADQLQALWEGYYGLNWVFLANVLLALGFRFIPMAMEDAASAGIAMLVLAILMFLVVAGYSFVYNRKIAFGKGWGDGVAVVASVLMGLNSVFCCGIIGYIVMQTIAATEMKNYGLKTGFLGVKKKEVQERIAQMRAQPTSVFPQMPFQP